MGTSNSLFSNNESSSNNQTEQENELSNEASLALLVGEGKKYADVGALAKAMVHSQNHITTLETEATTFKEKEAKQSSIDEILAAIKSNGNEQTPPGDNQLPADQQKEDPKDTVTVAQQIQTALEQNDQLKSAQSNVALVTSALTKSLGARANEVYTAVGKQLGVNLDELAKTSPEAVIKLCTGQQQQVQTPGQLPSSQHVLNQQQVVITDSSQMNQAQLDVHCAEVKMPREERFKLQMANALKQGDSFFTKQQ